MQAFVIFVENDFSTLQQVIQCIKKFGISPVIMQFSVEFPFEKLRMSLIQNIDNLFLFFPVSHSF